MTQHYPKPIAPPPELVQQWLNADAEKGLFAEPLAAKAAQWGADQELEACCEWLEQNQGRWEIPMALRDARRPKPPSLKEQALDAHNRMMAGKETQDDWAIVRRALEQLND